MGIEWEGIAAIITALGIGGGLTYWWKSYVDRKKINLEISGATVEVDRKIYDGMRAVVTDQNDYIKYVSEELKNAQQSLVRLRAQFDKETIDLKKKLVEVEAEFEKVRLELDKLRKENERLRAELSKFRNGSGKS